MIKTASLVLLLVSAATSMLIGELAFQKGEPVRHLVVFKYTPDASAEQIREVTEAFLSLKERIPGIVSFEYGVNNSPQEMNQSFTHVYLMTFADETARDTYLPHPEHEKFRTLLRESGVFEQAFVVDWVPKE